MDERTTYITNVIKRYAKKDDSILEIGCGSGRHLEHLKKLGYTNLTGLDYQPVQLEGIKFIYSDLEDADLERYDIVFTASCLFLIEDDDLVKDVQKLAKKYLMTFEGEVTRGNGVIGRDYSKVFNLKQVEHKDNMFNSFGHARVFKV